VTADGYEDYTSSEIEVKNEGVNYLDDWIKMTPKLSESDLKNLVAAYGTISAWEYHDYDGNGKSEAFAITTTKNDLDYLEIDAVYYVDFEGNVQTLDDTISWFFYENGDGAYRICEGKGFFWADMGGGGSGWQTLLYSVKNGVPYELDLSRSIQGFYEDESGFYTTENEFKDGGGHSYSEISLTYDSASQQFIKGDRRDEVEEEETSDVDEDSEELYKSVLNMFYENICSGWSTYNHNEDINNIESLFVYDDCSYMWYQIDCSLSEIGYMFVDLDNDGINELIVSPIDLKDGNIGMIYDMYSYTDGKITHIITSGERSRFYLGSGDKIYCEGSGSANVSVNEEYSIVDGLLSFDEAVVYDSYKDENNPWYYSNNSDLDVTEKISEEEAWKYIDSYVYCELDLKSFSNYRLSS
jgi:hypothetical protein